MTTSIGTAADSNNKSVLDSKHGLLKSSMIWAQNPCKVMIPPSLNVQPMSHSPAPKHEIDIQPAPSHDPNE